MNEKPQKLTVARILQVSNINNIAELQKVNDPLMTKPQETQPSQDTENNKHY